MGEFLVGRSSVEPMLEFGQRTLDLPRPRPDRAWHPVEGAQPVEDRALDPVDRIGLELETAFGLELVDRIYQPENSVRDQVGLVDVAWQSDRHPAGDELDQWRVLQDQRLPGLRIGRRLEVRPQVAQLFAGRAIGHCHESSKGSIAVWSSTRMAPVIGRSQMVTGNGSVNLSRGQV